MNVIPQPMDGGEWSPISPLWALRAWAFQPKWDGYRAIVHPDNSIVSRQGNPLIMAGHHSAKGAELCRALGAEWLDCELLGVRDSSAPLLPLVVHDAAMAGDYTERRAALENILPTCGAELPYDGIWLTPDSERGGEVWHAWREFAHIEGIIAKPIASPYQCKTWVKFKYRRA